MQRRNDLMRIINIKICRSLAVFYGSHFGVQLVQFWYYLRYRSHNICKSSTGGDHSSSHPKPTFCKMGRCCHESSLCILDKLDLRVLQRLLINPIRCNAFSALHVCGLRLIKTLLFMEAITAVNWGPFSFLHVGGEARIFHWLKSQTCSNYWALVKTI